MDNEIFDKESAMAFLSQFISFKSDGEPYFNEIRNLVDSIVVAFYTIKPNIKEQITDAEDIQNFSKTIKYVCDGCSLHDVAEIYPDDDGHVYISVYETFVPMFWSLCYFVYTTYSIGYAEKILSGSYKGQIEFESEKMQIAAKLWNFGKNLRNNPTCWPADLPKPLPTEKDELILKSNGLFVYGMSFILYHEIGHLLKYHLGSEPCVEQEKEADEFAIESCLNADKSIRETVKHGMILSLIAICLLDQVAGRYDKIHPNTDDRLQDALSKMNLDENDNAWMIASYGLLIWFTDFKFDYAFDTEYETAKGFFDVVLAKFRNNLEHC